MSTSASNAGGSAGNKVKGAAQTVHGVGESIRGGALDFVDSAVGHGKRHNASQRGAQETEQGIARMEGGKAGANNAGGVPQPGATADNSTHPGTVGNEKPHGGLGGGSAGGAGYGGSNAANQPGTGAAATQSGAGNTKQL
ncbi:hypothetical protein EIP91_007697 [Steccherinum ochraceum]|uniref:Uncharacterized protein n=1 Tax=Steccherinum ochraceum TaxID=92696 RepID=A0A4R0RC46_9APHY|nr:hypothetical protein EIP91_007697 [Steccherinum ochraceum]